MIDATPAALATRGALKGKVLFADDDPTFQEGLSRLLGRLGYECALAPDASGALQHLRSAEVDVLLSDIHMPGNEQLGFIQEVAAVRPGLPVVLLTGQPCVDTAIRGVRLAIAAYLVKPPDISELIRLLDESIHRYRRLQAVRSSRRHVENWAEELRQIEAAQSPGGIEIADFLSVTLQNLAIQLSELARPLALSDEIGVAAERIERVELVVAVQQTIATLEHTRQSFKSKELAELRKQLEGLLSGQIARGKAAAKASAASLRPACR